MKASRFYSAFAISLILFGLLLACSKTATTTNNPPPVPLPPIPPVDTSSGPDIYTTGTVSTYSDHFAAYWKNKQLFQLSDTESYASCITVVDTNVYVAGWGGPGRLTCYWKNGVFNKIYHGYINETVTDICSNGQDVYISGHGQSTFDHHVAEYWKNGQFVVMPLDFDNAAANGIAVSGSDVYLVGYAYNHNNRSQAVLWKNGTPTTLTDGKHFAAATGIFIQGSDVYISGMETDINDSFYVAKYWKNGQAVILSDSTSTCFTNCIFVDHNDVYVAGSQIAGTTLHPIGNDRATYWKNGVETKLFTGTEDSHTYMILTWDSDLYLTYNIYSNLPDSTTSPNYLKNQTPQFVDFGSFLRGDIIDIFIKSNH